MVHDLVEASRAGLSVNFILNCGVQSGSVGDPSAVGLDIVLGLLNDVVEVALIGDTSQRNSFQLVCGDGGASGLAVLFPDLVGLAVQAALVVVLDGLSIALSMVVQCLLQCLCLSSIAQSAASQHGHSHNTSEDDGQKFLCHFHDFCLHK